MLQVVSTGAYYPPLDTAERVLLPQHPTLQRGHCAFCQDFRWLVGFVVPPQYLTIPLFWWPLSSQSTQWHGGATRTMEERDAFGGDLSCPGGAQFFPFKDLHMCPFVPNFTFTFTFGSESEIRSCTIFFCSVCNSM